MTSGISKITSTQQLERIFTTQLLIATTKMILKDTDSFGDNKPEIVSVDSRLNIRIHFKRFNERSYGYHGEKYHPKELGLRIEVQRGYHTLHIHMLTLTHPERIEEVAKKVAGEIEQLAIQATVQVNNQEDQLRKKHDFLSEAGIEFTDIEPYSIHWSVGDDGAVTLGDLRLESVPVPHDKAVALFRVLNELGLIPRPTERERERVYE